MTAPCGCKFLGPVHQHLLLNSPFISRSPTGCGALAHLTPCQTPQSASLCPFSLFNVSLSRMDLFCCHPASPRPIPTSAFSPSFSLWTSALLFSPRHHHSFPSTLPPTDWAVKQEQAHGRPLTSRNSALELCCRTKRLQTLLNAEPGSGPAAQHWTLITNRYFCWVWIIWSATCWFEIAVKTG